jgi:hypothetical protein
MYKLIVAAIVVAAVGGAQVATAETGPVVASATGAGHLHVQAGTVFRTFSVSAREYADGTDKGQAQINRHPAGLARHIHIEIDCVRVIGSTAIMSGFVKNIDKEGATITPEGTPVWFAVRDNGEGPEAPPNQLSFAIFTIGEPGPTCEEVADVTFAFTVENGNIQVRS